MYLLEFEIFVRVGLIMERGSPGAENRPPGTGSVYRSYESLNIDKSGHLRDETVESSNKRVASKSPVKRCSKSTSFECSNMDKKPPIPPKKDRSLQENHRPPRQPHAYEQSTSVPKGYLMNADLAHVRKASGRCSAGKSSTSSSLSRSPPRSLLTHQVTPPAAIPAFNARSRTQSTSDFASTTSSRLLKASADLIDKEQRHLNQQGIVGAQALDSAKPSGIRFLGGTVTAERLDASDRRKEQKSKREQKFDKWRRESDLIEKKMAKSRIVADKQSGKTTVDVHYQEVTANFDVKLNDARKKVQTDKCKYDEATAVAREIVINSKSTLLSAENCHVSPQKATVTQVHSMEQFRNWKPRQEIKCTATMSMSVVQEDAAGYAIPSHQKSISSTSPIDKSIDRSIDKNVDRDVPLSDVTPNNSGIHADYGTPITPINAGHHSPEELFFTPMTHPADLHTRVGRLAEERAFSMVNVSGESPSSRMGRQRHTMTVDYTPPHTVTTSPLKTAKLDSVVEQVMSVDQVIRKMNEEDGQSFGDMDTEWKSPQKQMTGQAADTLPEFADHRQSMPGGSGNRGQQHGAARPSLPAMVGSLAARVPPATEPRSQLTSVVESPAGSMCEMTGDISADTTALEEESLLMEDRTQDDSRMYSDVHVVDTINTSQPAPPVEQKPVDLSLPRALGSMLQAEIGLNGTLNRLEEHLEKVVDTQQMVDEVVAEPKTSEAETQAATGETSLLDRSSIANTSSTQNAANLKTPSSAAPSSTLNMSRLSDFGNLNHMLDHEIEWKDESLIDVQTITSSNRRIQKSDESGTGSLLAVPEQAVSSPIQPADTSVESKHQSPMIVPQQAVSSPMQPSGSIHVESQHQSAVPEQAPIEPAGPIHVESATLAPSPHVSLPVSRPTKRVNFEEKRVAVGLKVVAAQQKEMEEQISKYKKLVENIQINRTFIARLMALLAPDSFDVKKRIALIAAEASRKAKKADGWIAGGRTLEYARGKTARALEQMKCLAEDARVFQNITQQKKELKKTNAESAAGKESPARQNAATTMTPRQRTPVLVDVLNTSVEMESWNNLSARGMRRKRDELMREDQLLSQEIQKKIDVDEKKSLAAQIENIEKVSEQRRQLAQQMDLETSSSEKDAVATSDSTPRRDGVEPLDFSQLSETGTASTIVAAPVLVANGLDESQGLHDVEKGVADLHISEDASVASISSSVLSSDGDLSLLDQSAGNRRSTLGRESLQSDHGVSGDSSLPTAHGLSISSQLAPMMRGDASADIKEDDVTTTTNDVITSADQSGDMENTQSNADKDSEGELISRLSSTSDESAAAVSSRSASQPRRVSAAMLSPISAVSSGSSELMSSMDSVTFGESEKGSHRSSLPFESGVAATVSEEAAESELDTSSETLKDDELDQQMVVEPEEEEEAETTFSGSGQVPVTFAADEVPVTFATDSMPVTSTDVEPLATSATSDRNQANEKKPEGYFDVTMSLEESGVDIMQFVSPEVPKTEEELQQLAAALTPTSNRSQSLSSLERSELEQGRKSSTGYMGDVSAVPPLSAERTTARYQLDESLLNCSLSPENIELDTGRLSAASSTSGGRLSGLLSDLDRTPRSEAHSLSHRSSTGDAGSMLRSPDRFNVSFPKSPRLSAVGASLSPRRLSQGGAQTAPLENNDVSLLNMSLNDSCDLMSMKPVTTKIHSMVAETMSAEREQKAASDAYAVFVAETMDTFNWRANVVREACDIVWKQKVETGTVKAVDMFDDFDTMRQLVGCSGEVPTPQYQKMVDDERAMVLLEVTNIAADIWSTQRKKLDIGGLTKPSRYCTTTTPMRMTKEEFVEQCVRSLVENEDKYKFVDRVNPGVNLDLPRKIACQAILDEHPEWLKEEIKAKFDEYMASIPVTVADEMESELVEEFNRSILSQRDLSSRLSMTRESLARGSLTRQSISSTLDETQDDWLSGPLTRDSGGKIQPIVSDPNMRQRKSLDGGRSPRNSTSPVVVKSSTSSRTSSEDRSGKAN